MARHKGLLPREGLIFDPIARLISRTALNPALLLPLLLLARFSKRGENLSILHHVAYRRIKKLFYLSLAKWLSAYYSKGVVNNWQADVYDWPREIAVVTGGAGGIGGHVVRLLAERAVKVVVMDIQGLTFEAGPNVHYYKCDLTSTSSVKDVAKRIRADVGDPTILVNNAGVARGKTILDTTEADLKFTFDVNLFAHFYTVQEFLPAMVRRNHGMIVTVASFAAWLTIPNMVDYGASKAAAASFHEGLSAEIKTRYNAPKIRTILVNQGYTKTALFSGYRDESSPFLVPALEPETVADAIVAQILSGQSGQVIAPIFGVTLQCLRALPHWCGYKLRASSEKIMTNFNGRQVVQDVEKHYRDREEPEAEGSTVLLSQGL